MKPSIKFFLLAAAMTCGFAKGQTTAYTTPVGYTTATLKPNQFTLVGLTLHNPTVSSGVVASATSNSVTITGIDFSTLLTSGATYVLEIVDGAGAGTIQEVSAWSGATITTPSDISALITPGVTKYSLRKAATVSSVFGSTNSVGLTPTPDGDPSVADKILIPNALNGFDTVFYFNDGQGTEGWLDAEGNLAADKVISYPDAFYVQRVGGSDLTLTVSGELKKLETDGVLTSGFNYLSSVAPVGLTLDNSGIKNHISQSADGDASTVDNVLLPNASGGFTTCFYFNDGQGTEGWLDAEGNLAGSFEFPSGFLILNRGGTKPYSLSVPSTYSTL